MTKFIVSIMTLAMAAGLAIAPQAASAKPHGHGDHDSMLGHRKCPCGSQWVPAHRGRNGRWIPAHCRPRGGY